MKIFGSAIFEGYKPTPDQIVVKIPGKVPVEIFYDRGMWRARSPLTGGEFKGVERPIAEKCAELVTERFERQIEPWVWRDETGEVTHSPGESSVTHLIGPHHMQAGLKGGHRKTMCGKTVPVRRLAAEQQVSCGQCVIAVEQLRANSPETVEKSRKKPGKAEKE